MDFVILWNQIDTGLNGKTFQISILLLFSFFLLNKRVFWIICCVLSWIASIFLMMASWDDFQNNAISFVIETNYLEWDTNFPSVVVCENENLERIMEVTDE